MQFVALEKCNNCASNCNSKLQLQKLVTVYLHCAPNSLGALRQVPNSLGRFMPQAPNSLRCIMHLSTELAFLPDAWLVTTLSVQTQSCLWFGLLYCQYKPLTPIKEATTQKMSNTKTV